ncbi:hypothetical protein Tco_1519279, partial [Tanacetum coccineum]
GTPIPYDPAPQADFIPDEINIKPNNEVALLYPEHTNKDYILVFFDFISKCCLKNAFTKTPSQQYKEYLVEFWYTAKILPKTNKVWFSTPTGSTKEEVGVNLFRNAIEANYLSHSSEYDEPPTQELVKQWIQTIRYSGPIEATCTLKKSLLPPSSVVSASSTEPVFLASTIIHFESASEHDALTDSIVEADLGKYAPNDSLSHQQGIKLEDMSKLVKDVNIDTMGLDSLEDDQPFMVVSDEEEEIHAEPHAKVEDTLVPTPQSPKSIKIHELSN